MRLIGVGYVAFARTNKHAEVSCFGPAPDSSLRPFTSSVPMSILFLVVAQQDDNAHEKSGEAEELAVGRW